MRFYLKWTAALFLSLLVIAGGYLAYVQLSGNFATVSPGQVYRSAQMSGATLVEWHQRHGIASVLNLRGAKDGRGWYETEKAVSERLGIEHTDYRLSASRQLTDAQITELVTLMRDAPKPLLIHCKAGADRSGIASALYQAQIDGVDPEDAGRQLSFRFGHISIPVLSAAWPMDETWHRVAPSFSSQAAGSITAD